MVRGGSSFTLGASSLSHDDGGRLFPTPTPQGPLQDGIHGLPWLGQRYDLHAQHVNLHHKGQGKFKPAMPSRPCAR